MSYDIGQRVIYKSSNGGYRYGVIAGIYDRFYIIHWDDGLSSMLRQDNRLLVKERYGHQE